MSSVLKVDQIQSDTGSVKVEGNLTSPLSLGTNYALKTWGASGPALQFGSGALVSQGATQTLLGSNYYINGSGNNAYITGGVSTRYMQSAGAHYFSYASSGSADAELSYTTVGTIGTSGQTWALEGASVASGTGITFPSSQNASSNPNTLDDYEEGTFSPTVNNISGTYTTTGNYVKIGRWVFITIKIQPTSGTVSGTRNDVNVSNLPFEITEQGIVGGSDNAIVNFGTGEFYAGTTAYLPTFSSIYRMCFSGSYLTTT